MRLLPKRGEFLMRPHCNPLNLTSFPFPPHHTHVDWKQHFPAMFGGTRAENAHVYCNTDLYPASYAQPRNYPLQDKIVRIVDVGCGYGGLLFSLAPLFPSRLIMGLQIRDKVVNYVGEKISAFRQLHEGQFDNIGVVRTNSMRHLCQYFPKQSLQKIFVCFPDPHFKRRMFKRRIISTGFLSEYAYLLKPGGRLYCCTDVIELHNWHLDHLSGHQMFKQVTNCQDDPCVDLMLNRTEQGKKVDREGGTKYWCVFQRIYHEQDKNLMFSRVV